MLHFEVLISVRNRIK